MGPAAAGAGGGATKIACVGDSITYGQGIADRERNCYPAVLGRMLGDGYTVRNFGVSGATMMSRGPLPYREQDEFAAAMRWEPDAVVVMLGTNDSRRWDAGLEREFAAECAAMLDRFAGLPSRPRLFVCLPPPVYPGGAEAPNKAIGAIRKVAAEKGAGVIDLDTPFRRKASLFPDGLHPNAEGAELIAREVHRALRDALPNPVPRATRNDR